MIIALPFRSTFAAASIGALLAAAPGLALAEAANPPPSDPPAVITAPAEAAPSDPPQGGTRLLPTPQETFGAIGKFIDQSISNVGAGVKGAGETIGATTSAAGDLAKGVTDAAGTVARLPVTNIVTGYQVCAAAPNGAPDCEVASLAMCKAKGFSRGNSVDITSSYKCPAQMWREGRAPNPHECRDESFVSKAVCQ
ncbi:MAG: hypothetical protein WDO17_26410 [Alphaproteobacteria bacterium]